MISLDVDTDSRTKKKLALRTREKLEKSRNTWPSNLWPSTGSSPVCSRVLSVCQHRPVLHPLGIPTHAIKQTVIRCCSQSELASHRIRTNATLSRQQQTTEYFQAVPSLIIFLTFSSERVDFTQIIDGLTAYG